MELNYLQMGGFIMHDQEPVEIDQINRYIAEISSADNVEKYCSLHPNIIPWYKTQNYLSEYLNSSNFIHLTYKTLKFPILCHSEKNSQDIQHLEKNNVITCYYWWHGMVARDWFRHWQHHNQLSVRNKSNENFRFLVYGRDTTGSRQYRTKVIDRLKKHQQLVNYNWSQDFRCPTLSAHISVEDANNSAIHVILETLFDTEKIYLTEKVFKPMVMCQPFILFAPPKSLQYLRDYGFKSFNGIWSEDYDLINDATVRKQTILDLVDSLAAIPGKQFHELYQELLPIVEHNKKHFYSNEFQDVLWNELQRNCSEALQKQQELSEQHYGGSWFYYLNQLLTEHPVSLTEYWKSSIHDLLKHNKINRAQLINTYPDLLKII